MAVIVPGVGTFDPSLPSWLELRADGKLYNKNAADPTKPWVPPAGFVGGVSYIFTPEGGVPAPVPVPEPVPVPAPEPVPAPVPQPAPAPQPSINAEIAAALLAFYGAERAALAADRVASEKLDAVFDKLTVFLSNPQ